MADNYSAIDSPCASNNSRNLLANLLFLRCARRINLLNLLEQFPHRHRFLTVLRFAVGTHWRA